MFYFRNKNCNKKRLRKITRFSKEKLNTRKQVIKKKKKKKANTNNSR